MDTKMKGLFKGLRYISQIFDNAKEPEMQIGFPTDVKHVAHIGWDGPTPAPNGPSWMNEFQSGTEGSPQQTGSSIRSLSGSGSTLDKPPSASRPPRHKSSLGDPESPQNDAMPRHPRQASSSLVGSPSHEGSTRHGRKTQSADESQPSDANPTVPKQNRRKKSTKGSSSSSGGSIKGSRSSREKKENAREEDM